MRLGPDRVAVTISGRDKGRLTEQDVMVVDLRMPILRYVATARKEVDPSFRLSGDGVHLDAVGHRKAQPVRLSRPVVRILTQDHRPDLVERGQLERAQPQPARRVDRPARSLLALQPAAEPA